MDSLDVGCGGRKYGDIGIDLQRGAADIIADAQRLPFKSQAFNSSYCSHVVEHVSKPNLLLSELYRVTRNQVTLKFPKAEYGNELMTHTQAFLYGFPLVLLNLRLLFYSLWKFYGLGRMKPAYYHRWLMICESWQKLGRFEEDEARWTSPCFYLLWGRKAKFFMALGAHKRVVGWKLVIRKTL